MYKIVKDKLAPRIDLLSGAQLIGNLGNLVRALPTFIPKLLKLPNKPPTNQHYPIYCQSGANLSPIKRLPRMGHT